jgi:hypothetical protein
VTLRNTTEGRISRSATVLVALTRRSSRKTKNFVRHAFTAQEGAGGSRRTGLWIVVAIGCLALVALLLPAISRARRRKPS